MRLNYRHFFARLPTHYDLHKYPICAFIPSARDIRPEGGRGRRHYDYASARRQIRRVEKNFLDKNRTSICFHEDIRKPRVTRACSGPIEFTILRSKDARWFTNRGSIVFAITHHTHALNSLYASETKGTISWKIWEKAEKKVSQMRAGQGKISLLSKTVVSSSSHLPFNSPTQKARITTHAAYKRAIPTERNANTNYLYSREHRAFSYLREKGSTRSNKNLNRSWTRIFRKFVRGKLSVHGFHVDSAEFTYAFRSLQTKNESFPEQGRIARRSPRLSSLAGCPFFTWSLSLFLFLYLHFSLFLFLSLPLVARLPFFSSFNSIFFFSF